MSQKCNDSNPLPSTKSHLLGFAVAAVLSAFLSVNFGIVIGNGINSYRSSSSSSTSSSSRKLQQSIDSQFDIPYTHPHLLERHLASIDDQQAQLDYIKSALTSSYGTNEVLGVLIQNIPGSVDEVRGKHLDEVVAPEIRAASWLVTVDTINTEEFLVRRFALAYMFYNNGGSAWNNNTHWLSPDKSHCDWYGITCCKNFLFSPVCANITADPDGVTEVDLFKNNLIGTIPPTIGLLSDVQSVFFSDNMLTGKIPTGIFPTLPKLLKLYLQHNVLTGPVPSVYNGVMDTFFIQGNDLVGEWPTEMCPPCKSCTGKVAYFGMDCDQVTCDTATCCNPPNCFYHPSRANQTIATST